MSNLSTAPVSATLGDITSTTTNVIIDVSATWCGPCKQLKPILEEISGNLPADTTLFILDADEHKDIVQELGVRSIPTMFYYRGGSLVNKSIGLKAKSDIEASIASLCS
jgi:thioredoxin 1